MGDLCLLYSGINCTSQGVLERAYTYPSGLYSLQIELKYVESNSAHRNLSLLLIGIFKRTYPLYILG
jgi:hypothetical protein